MTTRIRHSTRLIPILSLLIIVVTISSNISIVSATQTQVIFVNAGNGNGGTLTTLSVAYPSSGIQEGDLLLIQVVILITSISLTSVSDFSSLLGPYTAGTDSQTWIYYRYATGLESGSVTVTRGAGTSGMIARIYQFRNTAQTIGDAYEAVTWVNLGSVSTILDTGVTTTGPLELSVNLVTVGEDANTYVDFTGETGGDWTESIAQYSNAAGNDGTIQIQCATMATAGTINGGSYAMGASDPAGVLGFALKPEPATGDSYFVTVSESLDVSESIDTSVSWASSLSELIAYSESFYTAVGFGLGLSELITFYDSVVAEIFTGGDAYFLIVNEFVEFFDSIRNSVGFGLGLSELIAFYDSVVAEILESGFYSLIANEIISFIDNIGTSVSWATGISEIIDFAGTVAVVLNPANIITLIINEAIQIIELLGEFEEMNIFFELFLSTGIWGLFGPLALVVAGFFITQKEKGLGILFIIVDSIIVYQYLALPNYELYLWHVIILILGIMQCTFQLFSKRR